MVPVVGNVARVDRKTGEAGTEYLLLVSTNWGESGKETTTHNTIVNVYNNHKDFTRTVYCCVMITSV